MSETAPSSSSQLEPCLQAADRSASTSPRGAAARRRIVVNVFDLTGRLAVVRGARRELAGNGSGTGRSRGGHHWISAVLEPAGSAIGDAVLAHGRSFEAHSVDFADRDAVLALSNELVDSARDILINNAGTIERAPATDHPPASWGRVLQIDLTSQFILTQALARPMIARLRQGCPHGKLVELSRWHQCAGLYGGQVGRRRTHAIAPGYIATDNTQALRDDPSATARSSIGFQPDAGVKHPT